MPHIFHPSLSVLAGGVLACMLAGTPPGAFAGAALAAEIPSAQASAFHKGDSGVAPQPTYPGVENIEIRRGGQGSPSISLCYPATGQGVIDLSLRLWAEKTVASYEAEAREAAGEEKPQSYEYWNLVGRFTLSRVADRALSVTFSVYSYAGGAHGNLEITCLNFVLADGRRLDPADLFGDPHKALELMSAWTSRELTRELGDMADKEMIADGVAPDWRNFANLALTPEGVRIEFQPYQVAPWAAGPQSVDMPLADLASARPSALVWGEYGAR